MVLLMLLLSMQVLGFFLHLSRNHFERLTASSDKLIIQLLLNAEQLSMIVFTGPSHRIHQYLCQLWFTTGVRVAKCVLRYPLANQEFVKNYIENDQHVNVVKWSHLVWKTRMPVFLQIWLELVKHVNTGVCMLPNYLYIRQGIWSYSKKKSTTSESSLK